MEEVKTGTENIISMGEAFRKIIDIVEQVSSQMQDISGATRDMANNGEEIVEHIRLIGETSKTTAEEAETVSAATEEQTASVHEIASESTNLTHMAGEKTLQRLRSFFMEKILCVKHGVKFITVS